MSSKGQRKAILEHFKHHFATAAGESYSSSSNADWAAADLERDMNYAAANAPVFIDAFYTACEQLRDADPALPIPDIAWINRVLAEYEAGYQIQDFELVATRAHEPIAVPQRSPTLDQQAHKIIDDALATADHLLEQGQGRRAVQELLWLLETIATAFRGSTTSNGTVEGKYFNKIVAGRQQIWNWILNLHGYLSSPTGGGVRHGVDLKEGVAVEINDARLYCNLIRSYITFLIEEHTRLERKH